MEIKKSGSQASNILLRPATAGQEGPAEYFTGTVRIDPLFEAPELSTASLRPADVRGASVTFELAAGRVRVAAATGPGSHTAWHTHRSIGTNDETRMTKSEVMPNVE